MSDLTDLQERLRTQRPVEWEQLPDFALYMDQVLSYMDRQFIRFDEADTLTAAGYTAEQAAARLNQALAPWMIPVIIIGMLALVVFIVFISNAERRLPVQYAKRVVGRKMYGGQSTHIPMKVNMSGVMPIIFAQSIASLPATIGAFAGWTVKSEGFGGGMMRLFDTSKAFYSILYFFLIVGFSSNDC